MNSRTRKYNLSTIISAMVIILLIMDYTVFCMVDMPHYVAYIWCQSRKFLPGVIGVCLCGFVLYHCPYMINKKNIIPMYLMLVMLSITAIIFYSKRIYPEQSLREIVLTNGHFLYYFLSIPVLWLFLYEKSIYKLLDKINIVMLIWYTLIIMQKIIYRFTGFVFINMDNMFRDGRLRLLLLSFGNIMLLYNFNEFYNRRKRNRLVPFIGFIMGAYCMIFVQITRGFMIAVIIGISAIVLMTTTTIRKTAVSVLAIAGGVIFLIYSGILDRLLISLNLLQTGTITVRFEEMEYYFNEFLRNPIWGHGTIVHVNQSSIACGPRGIFYYSDVGLVGALAQYGLFSCIFMFMPIIYFTWITLKIIKNKKIRKEFGLLVGIDVYLISTLPTLSITDYNCIFLLPFCIAMFEYVRLVMSDMAVDIAYEKS